MTSAPEPYPASRRLHERHRLAYRWIPTRPRALDADCAWGDSTRWYARKAGLAPAVYRRIPAVAAGGRPWWEQEEHHRHYSTADLLAALDRSSFGGRYRTTRTFRSGLLLYPLALNLSGYLRRVLGEAAAKVVLAPFRLLGELDYWIPYGPLSYNLAVRLVKTG